MSDTKELAAILRQQADEHEAQAAVSGEAAAFWVRSHCGTSAYDNARSAAHDGLLTLALRESADLLEQQAKMIWKLREGLKDMRPKFVREDPFTYAGEVDLYLQREIDALLHEMDHP